ncbi:MAG: chemotaxis protein CheW, partial [Thiothrix sp.]
MQQSAETEVDLQANIGTDQYLTFMLAGEEYGLDILNVQEIKGWEGATPIPNTPEHILGVINLRGTVAPIVDLRNCFHLEGSCYGTTTVVIMVKAEGDKRDRVVGIVVDAVSEVYNVSMDEIEPPPPMGTVVSTEYIKGLATIDEKMIIILNISKMIESEISKEAYDVIV